MSNKDQAEVSLNSRIEQDVLEALGRFHATEPVNFIQRIHPISWVGAT